MIGFINMEEIVDKSKKHKPNYYLIVNNIAAPIFIKDLEAAKKLIMDMEQPVRLIKINR